jgi:hypothetical protein
MSSVLSLAPRTQHCKRRPYCAHRGFFCTRTLIGSADGVIIGFDDAEHVEDLFTICPLFKLLPVSVQTNKAYLEELVSAPQGARRALRRFTAQRPAARN